MSRNSLLVLAALALAFSIAACSPAKVTSNQGVDSGGSSSGQRPDDVGKQSPIAGGQETVRFLVPTVS